MIQSIPSAKAQSALEDLEINMTKITDSNQPEDIATLAYIWGFPLVTMERQFNFVTSPNTSPDPFRGPENSPLCSDELVDANFTDVVSPNTDTLYCQSQLNLKNEPVVIVVPPIKNRYYSFQFLDAYTNNFNYLGQRASGTNGGTYLLAGPQWTGDVPEEMTKIWSPTNLAWLITRILVDGKSDLSNVHSIQDKIIIKPLSQYLNLVNLSSVTSSSSTSSTNKLSNQSNEIPIGPQPYLIATTGIKIYDEISNAMADNSPNPPDPFLVSKLSSIGIIPGNEPSKTANDTIKKALEVGIEKGQKMIDDRVANLGGIMNGWLVNIYGVYGTDYLLRAAVTQAGLGANNAEEALYPFAIKDIDGKILNGTNDYILRFNEGQLPPVNAFWSVTMYNFRNLFVDNPLDRYNINSNTEGLKNNSDGSMDIYIQNENPGEEKISNWLPAPEGTFNMILRTYLPQEQILNGTWQLPIVKMVK